MAIMKRNQFKAAEAADAMSTALIAVEDCGADPELTKIVIALADNRRTLCHLFDLPPEQVSQADWLRAQMTTDEWSEAVERHLAEGG